MRRFVVAVAIVAACSLAMGDVTLAPLFQDGMVLQRGMKCPVWGTAEPGEEVCVSMCGKRYTAKADGRGDWRVDLDAMEAGGPLEMVVGGKNAVKVSDVYVGEVWICSGQSNMEFALRGAAGGAQDAAAADLPKIRLFQVPNRPALEPQVTCGGKWLACTPGSAPGFSAVGFYFGRELHEKLGVPIGLIQSDWGGTPAETWTPRPALEANPEFKGTIDGWKKLCETYDKRVKLNVQEMDLWRSSVEKARAEGQPLPKKPAPVRDPNSAGAPGVLYNGMIRPLVPYAIRGAIWYQGEANASGAQRYQVLLPTMIGSWRKAWGQGGFAFGIVQLANFKAVKAEPSESDWAALREAQAMTAANTPNCGLALAIDVGEASDIHPKDKKTVGHRLALWALATQYGEKVEYSGPVMAAVKLDGKAVRVAFRHAGSGLEAKGGELKGFALAGTDGVFVWADAKIDGDAVVVSSDKVAEPKAVRYAWADNPVCNLYNRDGLPAVPFRAEVK